MNSRIGIEYVSYGESENPDLTILEQYDAALKQRDSLTTSFFRLFKSYNRPLAKVPLGISC
jgi:hypothetical protein